MERANHLISILLLLPISGGCSPTGPELLSALSYPESPVVRNGDLYFAEYSGHTIQSRSLKTGEMVPVFQDEGCGPAAFAFLNDGHAALVSCYDRNELLVLNASTIPWQIRSRIQTDSEGSPLYGPNDFAVDESGGLFFTTSGDFNPDATASGRIYYFAADTATPRMILQGLQYSNGIALTDQWLFVAEHFGNQVIGFRRRGNGDIDAESMTIRLPDEKEVRALAREEGRSHGDLKYLGPDGLAVCQASQGGYDLFVAHFGAGRVPVFALTGDGTVELRRTIVLPDGFLYPTNVTCHEGSVFVTALRDAFSEPFSGSLLRY